VIGRSGPETRARCPLQQLVAVAILVDVLERSGIDLISENAFRMTNLNELLTMAAIQESSQ